MNIYRIVVHKNRFHTAFPLHPTGHRSNFRFGNMEITRNFHLPHTRDRKRRVWVVGIHKYEQLTMKLSVRKLHTATKSMLQDMSSTDDTSEIRKNTLIDTNKLSLNLSYSN
jgi:hypothetical protein